MLTDMHWKRAKQGLLPQAVTGNRLPHLCQHCRQFQRYLEGFFREVRSCYCF